MDQNIKRRKYLILTIIAAAFLLGTGLKFLYQIEHSIDIGLYDETEYLQSGVALDIHHLPSGGWSPLYLAWYHFLHYFQPDRIELYYLNYRLMTILPALLTFWVLLIYRTSILSALIISFFFLISAGNLPLWPKICHFEWTLILAFLILAHSFRRWCNLFLICTLCSLTSAYVRPEYSLTFVISSGVLLFFYIRQYRSKTLAFKDSYPALIILIFIFFSLLFLFGTPIALKRNMLAIKGALAINIHDWKHLTMNPYTNNDLIVDTYFGRFDSLLGAILVNPWMFARHLLTNTINMISLAPRLTFLHVNMFIPSEKAILRASEGILLLIIFAGYLWGKIKQIRGKCLQQLKEKSFVLYYLLLLSLPSFVISWLYIPLNHHLIILLFLSLLAIIIAVQTGKTNRDHFVPVVMAGLCMLLFVPMVYRVGYLQSNQNNLKTINALRGLKLTNPVRMLEAEGGFNHYLGSNFSRVSEYLKKEGFFSFLKKENISVIVLSNKLVYDNRFQEDPEWNDFLSNHSKYGFEAVPVLGGEERSLLIKKELLRSDYYLQPAL